MASAHRQNQLIFDALSDFVFPKSCALCPNHGEIVCKDCENKLERAIPRCIVCSRNNILGRTCPSCQKKNAPKLTVSIFSYQKGAKNLIKSFKYEDITSLKGFFAKRLADIIKNLPDYKDYTIVPIPLASSRKRFRGYNQSELLTREASKILKLPFCKALKRVELRQPQALSASKLQRMKNIKGVFISAGQSPEKVLLLDDVITTGATMREAAKILKRAGAQEIISCSVAM
ncbi:MAG: ComF family protein [bacterium]